MDRLLFQFQLARISPEITEVDMSYLRNVINLPDTKQFRDCKSSKTLFSLKDDTLPFDISGTTDVKKRGT